MEKEIKDIDFIPIQKLQNKNFIVKDYQRGYKWEKEQIVALLKDINNHKTGKYCLQPVIVATLPEGIEVIDGQQRITSIYILLYYLKQIKFYNIEYQTREITKWFLKNEMGLLYNAILTKMEWVDFLNSNSEKDFNNVDVFHIFNVVKEIHNWFIENIDVDKDEFINKVKDQVCIIWYNVNENQEINSPEEIFLNLNAGKIPLTSSELIKALFILDIQKKSNNEIGQIKAFEIANDWDSIENQLQDDSFWYFICDNNYYNTIDTRIDLIIDLSNGIQPPKTDKKKQLNNDWDGKEAYRLYETLFLEEADLNWQKVKQTFNKLKEWYADKENKELYHYIGYLINTKMATLLEIINLSKGVDKFKFKDKLVGEIKTNFKKTKNKDNNEIAFYKIENLDYLEYRVACQNVLLLLNVEQFINNYSSNKFPFDLYKKEKWSVEHINPQNPRDFNDIGALINWLESFKKYYISKKDEQELVKNISTFLNLISKEPDKSKKLSKLNLGNDNILMLNQIVERITQLLELHKISNLALLDMNTNIKLSNKTFIEKRKELLKLVYNSKKEKIFIPENTKDVFTKNYSTNNDDIIEEIFGKKDMEDYYIHIENQLKKYYD